MSNCVPSAGEGESACGFFERESLNSVVASLDREAKQRVDTLQNSARR